MIINSHARRPAAAAIELAALLPFLVFVSVISTDWARLFYYSVTIESCARNGALYASDTVSQAQSPYSNLQQAAMADAPTLDVTATVTSSNTVDSAGNSAVIVTVSVPFVTITNFPGVPNSQTLSRKVQMTVAPTVTK